MPLSPIPEILDELRAGRLIVLVDDENRENEGDFVCAAEKVTTDLINFMTRVGAGYLCVPLAGPDCLRLELSPQASLNTSLYGTPLTVSVDGHPRHGVGTGVSAKDRVRTIQLLIDQTTGPGDLVRPGHINPLRARDGGVLVRTGQTEGSVDLARLAGLHPAAVLIEIVNEDGTMARMPELETLCVTHDMKMCSVEQIIEYRLARERLVTRIDPAGGTPITTPWGRFDLIAYQSTIDPLPHLALTVGGVGALDDEGQVKPIDEPVLVRMHRRDLLGDIFEEQSKPSGRQLRESLQMIQDAGRGALVYLRPEGEGEGLRGRLQRISRIEPVDVNVPDLTRSDGIAGRAQPMDQRDFGIGGQILRDLGLQRLRVLTNHPKHMPGLQAFGLEIVESVPIKEQPDASSEQSLRAPAISHER
ncbi:MAG: 3,4-dihydroxy-2-butanone-4-phosphate synthase [Planctomycetota bacterium]|jgi:3,4-dihydroxy 2-butanone 4-phosphate synthase/GTP cyclohydrolase II